MIAKVEESGYIPNGVMAAIQMRAKLRGLVDKNGQPIFKTDMQGDTRYALDGMNMYFPVNGAYDPDLQDFRQRRGTRSIHGEYSL